MVRPGHCPGHHSRPPLWRRRRRLSALVIVPVGICLLVVLPYYAATLPATIERYRTQRLGCRRRAVWSRCWRSGTCRSTSCLVETPASEAGCAWPSSTSAALARRQLLPRTSCGAPGSSLCAGRACASRPMRCSWPAAPGSSWPCLLYNTIAARVRRPLARHAVPADAGWARRHNGRTHRARCASPGHFRRDPRSAHRRLSPARCSCWRPRFGWC